MTFDYRVQGSAVNYGSPEENPLPGVLVGGEAPPGRVQAEWTAAALAPLLVCCPGGGQSAGTMAPPRGGSCEQAVGPLVPGLQPVHLT